MPARFLHVGQLLFCLSLCSCGSQRMMQTDLYFGQLKLNGDTLSKKEWNDFTENHLSKVFTNGSTIINGTGNWYNTTQKRMVAEPSIIVTAINRRSPQLNRKIDSLRNKYMELYHQQSVLRVDHPVKIKLF